MDQPQQRQREARAAHQPHGRREVPDSDLIEVHEALASRALATPAAREKRGLSPVDRARMNVAGSSPVTGHPFAATGARIIAPLARLPAGRDAPARGLISVCAAGGQGVTAIPERT
ncbi:hypothetical protein GCM10027162_68830 [Streptomyces incanus]